MTAKKKSKPKWKPGVVARVWQTATKMNGAERKDVLAACAKAGINKSTAVTQYYHWKAATPAERQQKLARWAVMEPKQ